MSRRVAGFALKRAASRWSDQAIARSDERMHLIPVDTAGRREADPPLVANAGRHEEAVRIASNDDRLGTVRLFDPQ
jgi:hypothetical protein